MKRSVPALLLLAGWIVALVVLGAFINRHLKVGTDLRLFLPSPTTAEQRLVLDSIGEGPASRVLVAALDGEHPEQLADISRALVENLDNSEHFRFVANGEVSFDSLPEQLLPYRFLLDANSAARDFTRDGLRAAIETRARDLGSPAAFVLEPLIPRDPTLELLTLLERWQPTQEPHREFDVWFDRAGRRALLVAETRAPAFDPTGQRAAQAALEQAFHSAAGEGVSLTVSGAGSFSVLMEARTQTEAQSLAQTATVGALLILLVAYRRFGPLLLCALPLASAALAGLAAVSAWFGAVHGITLAFGFTLIGVVQDYPVHLLSHRRPTLEPAEVARRLWPTLATGMASTCVAYLTFLLVGVIGLAQLACFTVAGLLVAGLTTRYLLPTLLARESADYGGSPLLGRLWNALAALPRPGWAGPAVIVACLAIVTLAPQPFWENDLGTVTPVPRDLLQQDRELREQLGTADIRYLLVVEANDADAALTRLEALDPVLQGLVARGVITGYDHAARYLPSLTAQRSRQAELPDEATLRTALDAAVAGTPFRPGTFEPFLADVERARSSPPLTIERFRDSGVGSRLEMLLREQPGGSTALVTFSGVRDSAALRELVRDGDHVTLLDVKTASESLVVRQRTTMLASLAVGSVLLIIVVAFALRSRTRVRKVLTPMALTTFVIIGALQAAGVSLNLFHLISLILAAGLGLDYALFFEHAADDPAEQRRTLHAVLVSAALTLLDFLLLATSNLPVLQAIGTPVAIGVAANFILALLLTRPPHTSV